MKRIACLVLLLALAGCRRKQPLPPAPEAPPPPAVVRTSGELWRELPDGKRVPFSVSEPLREGELLVTSPDGAAVVRVGPGRQIELRPGSRLKLHQRDGQWMAELESGLVVSRSTEAAPSVVLTVLTPFGITRVPGGKSEATISVDKDGARIDVSFGEIAFVDASGKTTTAGPRDAIEVKLGSVELVKSGTTPAPEHLDVVLSSEIGPLLIQAPGERRFTPRRAAPAPAGTGFKVSGAGGRARLLAPGLQARLEGGAAGRVGEASRSGNGRRFGLTLERGTALLTVEGGQAHEVVLEGKQPITLRATEATTFSVAADRGRAQVTVLAGSGEVVVGETTRRLGPSERAAIRGTRLAVGARPPSDVVLPTARGLHVYADGLPEVTLSWNGSEKESLVEVASDPDFKDVLLTGRVSGNSVTVPAPRRADLYWRITGKGDKPVLGHARFEPDRRRSVLDLEHPHNLVGESGPMTTVYFQGVVPTLTFSYAAKAGAAKYRLRVYKAGALDQPIVERVVSDTRCPVDANVLKEGSYVWHAVPLSAQGQELAGGRMNKLELVYDNALTRLAIGSPKPNEVATGPEVEALGVAPLGSKLYINGKAAHLDGKGRFQERVSRAPAVVFRLVGKNGSESYWIRKLRVRS